MSVEKTTASKKRKIFLYHFKLHGTDFYCSISETSYVSSKHSFIVHWPRAERGDQPIRLGVCNITIKHNRTIVGNAWLWELPSKRLIRQQFVNNSYVEMPDFEQTEYPVDFELSSAKPREPEGSWELPEMFGMILDMDQGALRFRIDDRVLDAAFQDELKGENLHLAFFGKKNNFKLYVWDSPCDFAF